MIKRTLSTLSIVVLLIGLSGCGSLSRAERGALIGAGIGTAAGAVIDDHDPARGAVVGAAAGALGGYVIGRETDNRYYDDYGRGHYGHHGDTCGY